MLDCKDKLKFCEIRDEKLGDCEITEDDGRVVWRCHNYVQCEKCFRCKSCQEIMYGQEEVNKHKEENWEHNEYEMLGTKLNLGFV